MVEMKEYKEYMLVTGGDYSPARRREFEQQITSLLNDGWECVGGVSATYCVGGAFLAQSMVKTSKN
jgi:hypothetical protein